ncbi:MAG: double-strand break repair protein AddB [Paracoccaceae bacterium]
MTLFEPSGRPRVFGLPPGSDFIGELVAGLRRRLRGAPPQEAARVRIYLNTRRAARALQERLSQGSACLLPDIRVIADLAADPFVPADLPPPAEPLERKLLVARLAGALLEAEPELGPRSAMFGLADGILKLLDEIDAEGASPEMLDTLDVEGFSGHWARSLRFLTVLRDSGLAGKAGPEARLRQAATALAEAWRRAPVPTPVIVAGSTGSRGSTALFMRAVAGLPQGAVILPGLDTEVPDDAWQAIAGAPDHPQYGVAAFLGSVGLEPGEVPLWTPSRGAAPARARLLSLALRPAPVTDRWIEEGPDLRRHLREATEHVTLLEADGPRQEAAAVALHLRAALARGKPAALVTPDRVLARRVGAHLRRWKIVPDDSAGRPLALTPPGTLLRMLADASGQPMTPVRLLALLKHPLSGGSGSSRKRHLNLTRRLETDRLRGGSPFVDWTELTAWAAAAEAGSWTGWLQRICQQIEQTGPRMLAAHLSRHRALAEALSAGPEDGGGGELWDKEAGIAALGALEALQAAAEAGGELSDAEYRALLASHFSGIEVREEAFQPHPGVSIWGTLEARTQTAAVIVMGGLNEAVWPPQPAPDPWLNRAMREALGLSPPERRTGLSAHDFQQAAAAREVVLSRTLRDGRAPTVPSRWLTRFRNLVGGLGQEGQAALQAMLDRGAELAARAEALDRPAGAASPAPRPAPAPPAGARPRRLSVTRVETLIRDPYAVYAGAVLRLRPLDPAGKRPDMKTRGMVFHGVLEAFISETMDGLPDDPTALFGRVAERILTREVPWPSVRKLWRARLLEITPWFVETELARRREGAPLVTEIPGETEIGGTPLGFRLSARADRIDRKTDGSLRIIDYKSGQVPTAKEVEHFAKQLVLEAVMASQGGFDGLDASPVSSVVYVGLGSGGKLLEIPLTQDRIEEARRCLVDLVASYQSAAVPFPARTRIQYLKHDGDYDQLSRLGEWQDGDKAVREVVG